MDDLNQFRVLLPTFPNKQFPKEIKKAINQISKVLPKTDAKAKNRARDIN